MLRKIRTILAAICFAIITLLLLDFTGTIRVWFGWMAKIQFMPAILALNAGVIIGLIALTLIFGRVYCSVICPLGIFQDIISWLSCKRKKARNKFSFSKANNWLRYTLLVLFVVAFALGIGSFVALLSPYSSYGRIVSNLFAPLYQWGNNLLALIAERVDSYAFYSKEVWIKSLPTFIVSAITLIAIFILAWRSGRAYCNNICPVGSFLGLISRFSIFKVKINTDKCTGCTLCARNCKASCINPKEHKIDYSRCVVCFDCIGNCKQGAISFTAKPSAKKEETAHKETEKVDTSRRNALAVAGALLAASTLKAQEQVNGGLAAIEKKKVPQRATCIVPFGAKSIKDFQQHCTACQLCVSACPNNVLRPSTDLLSLMQPVMSYERGYCRPECTKCSEVCPSGAIKKIDVEEKYTIKIGTATWIRDNCIPITDGVSCGNCARHCPKGAIKLVSLSPGEKRELKIPSINAERCIGCGSCESVCPARPYSAIYVEGIEVHRTL